MPSLNVLTLRPRSTAHWHVFFLATVITLSNSSQSWPRKVVRWYGFLSNEALTYTFYGQRFVITHLHEFNRLFRLAEISFLSFYKQFMATITYVYMLYHCHGNQCHMYKHSFLPSWCMWHFHGNHGSLWDIRWYLHQMEKKRKNKKRKNASM